MPHSTGAVDRARPTARLNMKGNRQTTPKQQLLLVASTPRMADEAGSPNANGDKDHCSSSSYSSGAPPGTTTSRPGKNSPPLVPELNPTGPQVASRSSTERRAARWPRPLLLLLPHPTRPPNHRTAGALSTRGRDGALVADQRTARDQASRRRGPRTQDTGSQGSTRGGPSLALRRADVTAPCVTVTGQL